MRYVFLLVISFSYAIKINATELIVTVGNGGNTFIPSTVTINPGDTVTWVWSAGFHNTSALTFPAGAVTWYANITAADTIFSYVPAISGLYTYTCTHHSGMDGQFFVTGCSYPAKPVIVSANGNAACTGDTLLLSVPSQTGVSYQWINGMTAVPFSNGPSLAVVSSGTYKVLVNRCGVDSISDPFNAILHALPTSSFSYTNAGLSYTFTSSQPPPLNHSFLWKFSDGVPDQTTVNAFHTFASPGSYTVTLTVTDTITNCASTSLNTIVVTPPTTKSATPGFSYSIASNPATSFIELKIDGDAFLFLTDLNGNVIHAPMQHQYQVHTIDVSTLPNGVYLLSITTKKNTVVEKMIVAH